jgi:hypothetical protein
MPSAAIRSRFGVVVGEQHALGGDSVEVRRPARHHAAMVGTDVPDADVVAHDDDDVGALLLLLLRRRRCARHHRGGEQRQNAGPGIWPDVHCRLPFSLLDGQSRCSFVATWRVTTAEQSVERRLANMVVAAFVPPSGIHLKSSGIFTEQCFGTR